MKQLQKYKIGAIVRIVAPIQYVNRRFNICDKFEILTTFAKEKNVQVDECTSNNYRLKHVKTGEIAEWIQVSEIELVK
jgi:hypothetical protein